MIIAIIGSPLSGKTSLLKKLAEKNVKVFHTDSFITKIYQKGQSGYELIKREFGSEFVNDVEVNKRRLAEFSTISDNLSRLNELIHPLIFSYLDGKDNYVAELPIISNSSIKFKYDKVVLVTASSEKITERFLKKNFQNPNFIKKIINDWNIENDFDYVINTTNGINDIDVINIVNLLNKENNEK